MLFETSMQVQRRAKSVSGRNLIVVRTRKGTKSGRLSTVARPWVSVKVTTTKKPAKGTVKAVRTGTRIIANQNKRRTARGQKPIDTRDWAKNQKMRVIKVVEKGDTVWLKVEPRGFSEFLASRAESASHRNPQFRRLIREHLLGERDLLKRQVQLLASAALLTIGDRYIVLPLRSKKTALYQDLFHVFGGYGEAPLAQFLAGKVPQPHQTARRELAEETGIKKRIQVLGPDLSPSRLKNPRALVAIHNWERQLPYLDAIYLARIKTIDPKAYIERHFNVSASGELTPKAGEDKWEMKSGILLPFSRQAIVKFLDENSGRITPMAFAALTALSQTKQVPK